MTDVCVHVMCERPRRARGLCEMHYGRLKRAGLGELRRSKAGRPSGVKLDAQQGINRNCVDCGQQPYGGGMRCLPCFQLRCDMRAAQLRKTSEVHTCVKHDPSPGCYVRCQCRCAGCRAAKSEYAKERLSV